MAPGIREYSGQSHRFAAGRRSSRSFRGALGASTELLESSNHVRLLCALHCNVGVPIARGSSGNDAEHLPGVDRLAFFDVKALDRATLWRANFVLHFHGFDNQEALTRCDFVSGLDKIEMSDSSGRAARPRSLHFGRGFHALQSFECLGNGPSHGNILSHFGFIYTEEPTLPAAPFESGRPTLDWGQGNQIRTLLARIVGPL